MPGDFRNYSTVRPTCSVFKMYGFCFSFNVIEISFAYEITQYQFTRYDYSAKILFRTKPVGRCRPQTGTGGRPWPG